MNIHNSKYEITAVNPEQYPKRMLPEIAFVGRSNVGKSSTINALLYRKNLARVSATPGKTRVINFYNIDDQLYLVDLPGYGYARVAKTQKAAWGEIVETYLLNRRQLKLVVLLVDIRHTPSEDDQLMLNWLVEKSLPFLVIATKADKVKHSQLHSRLTEIKDTFALPPDQNITPFSSATMQGRDEAWRKMLSYLK